MRRAEQTIIGISCGLMSQDSQREVFNGRPLAFVERSLPRFIGELGAQVVLIAPKQGSYNSIVAKIDGLVLQGGADIAPESYGESPLNPEWKGDRERDSFELRLLASALEERLPVLGICRGAQLINIHFGGTLYQDIATQLKGKLLHRCSKLYEKNTHGLHLTANSLLESIYSSYPQRTINSVHHQAISKLGDKLAIEALAEDGIIEAIRVKADAYSQLVLGIQWHPEFQEPEQSELLPAKPLLAHFMQHVLQGGQSL